MPVDQSPQLTLRKLIKLLNLVLAGYLVQYWFWLFVVTFVHALMLVPPYLIGRVIDFLTTHSSIDRLQPLYVLTGALSVTMIGAALIRLRAKEIHSQCAIRAGYQARVMGFDKLMSKSLLWHQTESTGNKVQRIATSSLSLEIFLKSAVGELLPVFVHSSGAIAAFFYLNWRYGLVGLLYFTSFLTIQTFFYFKVRGLMNEQKRAGESATGSYVEGTSNILTIKTLNLEKSITSRVVSREDLARDLKLQINRLNFLKWRCFQTLTGLVMGGFILKVSFDVLAGQTSAGDLAMLFAYFKTLQDAAGDSTGLYDTLIDNWISIARMVPIFDELDGVPQGSAMVPPHWNSLELKNIRAQYGGDRGGLKSLTLSIQRGEQIGVVGSSGAGKSTLAKVLLGVLAPQDGSYEVGGVPFSSLSRVEIGNHFSMVLQESELFNMTMRENITVLRQVSSERLARAVRIAGLTELVAKLDSGLDTVIGEKGYRLSGGERQRIGIARAICRESSVIVFDEATSALDGETESNILSAINAELSETTLIIIAHRLSTLKSVARIVVIEDGGVVELGTPAELLALPNSKFAVMSRLQEKLKPQL